MLSAIWSLTIGTMWGRIITACLAGLLLIKGYGMTQRWKGHSEGVAAVVDNAKKEGKKANEKAAQIRNSARKPGSFKRLLADPATCRDC